MTLFIGILLNYIESELIVKEDLVLTCSKHQTINQSTTIKCWNI